MDIHEDGGEGSIITGEEEGGVRSGLIIPLPLHLAEDVEEEDEFGEDVECEVAIFLLLSVSLVDDDTSCLSSHFLSSIL